MAVYPVDEKKRSKQENSGCSFLKFKFVSTYFNIENYPKTYLLYKNIHSLILEVIKIQNLEHSNISVEVPKIRNLMFSLQFKGVCNYDLTLI